MRTATLLVPILVAALIAPNALAQGAPAPAPAAAAQPAPAAAAPASPGGDPAKGRLKTVMCQGCHGIDGWRTAYPEVYRVPKLGGQHEAYLAKALQEYQNGERTHPSMRGQAAVLSDQDIADLAAYYARGNVTTARK